MISVVIPTLNDAPGLTATLAALTPAAIDGFVRKVIVSDGGSSDETFEVAEDAGAAVVTTGFADAIGQARPWVLILVAGARPQVGWEQAAHAHMRDWPDKAGYFDIALPGLGIGARVREAAARLGSAVFGRVLPAQGLLITNQQIQSLGPVASREDLLRGLGRSQMRRIGARALDSNTKRAKSTKFRGHRRAIDTRAKCSALILSRFAQSRASAYPELCVLCALG